MKTPTHAIAGWLIARCLNLPAGGTRALVLGAAAPDFPVIFGGSAIFALCQFNGRPDLFKPMMDAAYFGGTFLSDAHSFLHSPANLVLLATGAYLMRPFFRGLSERLGWFLLGAASHAALDILTHVEDAPLILWPFSLEFRWPGPLSHWDHRHYGDVVTAAEFFLWATAVFVGVVAAGRHSALRPR